MPKTPHAAPLLAWYDHNRRRLPWRAEAGQRADPYHVWLSEIMLQQTTVATVKSYFAKFLGLWPTVFDLASAERDAVMQAWAGLGYYARARNLHACAQIVATDHGGIFPRSEAELLALPGVGAYTAAAIAAIAFGEPAVVVDGNIERIVTRLFTIDTPLPKAKPQIKQKMADILAAGGTARPGDLAQGMMDLGASICTPKSPQCLLCPWQADCRAKALGKAQAFPVKAVKKPKPVRRAIAFWPVCEGRVLLQRRAPSGLLGGTLGLYGTDWRERDDFPSQATWRGAQPVSGNTETLPGVSRHTFTHFHLETRIIRVLASADAGACPNDGRWHDLANIDDLGLPTVFAKMISLIRGGEGSA